MPQIPFFLRRTLNVMTTALALLPLSRLHAQPDLSQVQVKVVPVAPGVYMLEGGGGNIGLSVGDDDAFLIDDQYAPMTAKVKAAVATVTSKPVRFVVNTHWHNDHTGGNEAMAGSGAIIFAHENVRRRMTTDQFLAAFNARIPASPKKALPVVTFSDTLSFYLNGDTIRSVHVANAHTDGDAIIFFRKANVIHMGDAFFNGFYPFIDVSTGGSVVGTIRAANHALAMSNAGTRFIPGHGPLATRADLVRYRDMMVSVRDTVSRLIARGRTLSQVIAARPLADLDARWGQGFLKPEQFLTIAYESLRQTRNRPARR
ncbi:MAG TPA: MBL fold metallo-hydrolase [Gemmatimonadaceae bacterium]|nr:MBL fold metallo-hydrolase [Gemmatimonadaceae bacterium]